MSLTDLAAGGYQLWTLRLPAATVLTVFLPSAGRNSQVERIPGLTSLTVQARIKDCGVNSFYKWTHSSLFALF